MLVAGAGTGVFFVTVTVATELRPAEEAVVTTTGGPWASEVVRISGWCGFRVVEALLAEEATGAGCGDPETKTE